MTFAPATTNDPALEENITFAHDQNIFFDQITRYCRDSAKKVNQKENGYFPLEIEILNNQNFFTADNPRMYRSVFRKVFAFGAIAAGAVLNIAHGIDTITLITHFYGSIVSAVPDDRPLPYTDTALATNQVSLLRNGINIVITNGATAPAITSGIVIIEYLKQ